MFQDQTVELLPARTTMQLAIGGKGGRGGTAVAVNLFNVNLLGDQLNVAAADASGGSGGDAINVFKSYYW